MPADRRPRLPHGSLPLRTGQRRGARQRHGTRERQGTRQRRAWLGAGAGAAVLVAAGLGGCGTDSPAALSLRCSGSTLATPDSTQVLTGTGITSPTATSITGVPHAVSAALTLPDALDPTTSGYGYGFSGSRKTWSVSLISNAGDGNSPWTVALRPPRGVADPGGAVYAPESYPGYAIVRGGSQQQLITAVSASGRQGPSCQLPHAPGPVDTALLPHAGVVIIQNPVTPGLKAYHLDGYSTAAGGRLWSVPAPAEPGSDPSVLTDGDTIYIWQDLSQQIAAYNGRTGQHLWTAGVPGAGGGQVPQGALLAAFGGRVYALFAAGTFSAVAAFNAASGALLWKHAVPSDAISDRDAGIIQVGSSEVLVGNDVNGQVALLRASSGKVLAQATVSAGAAVDNDQTQVCYPGGQLAIAVPDNNGTIQVLSADRAYDRSIAVAPGKDTSVGITRSEAYVFPAPGGTGISGYDLATGKVLWTVPSGRVQPADSQLSTFNGGFALSGSQTSLVYR